MSDVQPESPNDDKYAVLGLVVVSRHEALGLNDVLHEFQTASKKIRLIQLVTAALLLCFLITDMLPYGPVLLSAAAVFIAVIFLGKQLFATAFDDAKAILDDMDFGPDSENIKEAISNKKSVNELVHTGTLVMENSDVVNVDGDEIAICRKVTEASL